MNQVAPLVSAVGSPSPLPMLGVHGPMPQLHAAASRHRCARTSLPPSSTGRRWATAHAGRSFDRQADHALPALGGDKFGTKLRIWPDYNGLHIPRPGSPSQPSAIPHDLCGFIVGEDHDKPAGGGDEPADRDQLEDVLSDLVDLPALSAPCWPNTSA